MGEVSEIEWTDSTWTPIRARNPVTGLIGWHCEHVSEGCRNCYAEGINLRLGTRLSFKPGHLSTSESYGGVQMFLDETMLLAPLKWKKPRCIFVCSMTDLFAGFVKDDWIDRVFAVMALCPQHRFQVLTKRAKRMREYLQPPRLQKWCYAALSFGRAAAEVGRNGNPLPNVWLGISAEDQANWDERKRHLRETPAAIHFASFEPLLGPIVDENFAATIQWAIVGGESGRCARPMHPDWARSIRNQCAAAGVPFFFKQWGTWAFAHCVDDTSPEVPMNWREKPDRYICIDRNGIRTSGYGWRSEEFMVALGKKRAGRLLDGREWNEMPG